MTGGNALACGASLDLAYLTGLNFIMAGILFVIFGVLLVCAAPVARTSRARKWLEDELDAPKWRVFRESGWSWWRNLSDWHYRTSRKLLPVLLPPVLLFIGLFMVISGIEDLL